MCYLKIYIDTWNFFQCQGVRYSFWISQEKFKLSTDMDHPNTYNIVITKKKITLLTLNVQCISVSNIVRVMYTCYVTVYTQILLIELLFSGLSILNIRSNADFGQQTRTLWRQQQQQRRLSNRFCIRSLLRTWRRYRARSSTPDGVRDPGPCGNRRLALFWFFFSVLFGK